MEQIDPLHRLGSGGTHECSTNPCRGDALQQIRRQVVVPIVGTCGARVAAVGIVGQAAEHPSDILEGLALQKEVALLPECQLIVEIKVVATGQQAPGLELDERGGDQ